MLPKQALRRTSTYPGTLGGNGRTSALTTSQAEPNQPTSTPCPECMIVTTVDTVLCFSVYSIYRTGRLQTPSETHPTVHFLCGCRRTQAWLAVLYAPSGTPRGWQFLLLPPTASPPPIPPRPLKTPILRLRRSSHPFPRPIKMLHTAQHWLQHVPPVNRLMVADDLVAFGMMTS